MADIGFNTLDLYFQYPQSDRRRCNPEVGASADGLDAVFQYPQSDRRRCNDGEAVAEGVRSHLSVSSVGSEALQPFPKRFPPDRKSSFSILSRIGGVATSDLAAAVQDRLFFQYPQSDRRRCNV